MDKRAAKRWACRCAANLLQADHVNDFLYEDDEDWTEPSADTERKVEAWNELVGELYRRGEERHEKP